MSQYYWPEHAMIPTLLAEELQRRGHQVQVLTTFPHYPTGQLADGYRQRLHLVERVRGVRVHRVPMLIDRSESIMRRAASYASFAASTAVWRRLAASADVVYVYATQMTAALGPVLWRRTGGPPVVLHVQDLWPDSILGASFVGGRSGRAISALLDPLLRRAYRAAAATISISDGMSAELVRRGVPKGRAHAVSNWASESTTPPAARRSRGTRETTRFLYAGNLGDAQRLDVVLRAAALLDGDQRFSLDIFGSGGAESGLRELAATLELSSVTFHGRVSAEAMPDIYRDHDFQIVSLDETPALLTTIPSKLPTSFMHGLPVLAAARGASTELVERHGAGIAAEAVDAEGIASAFQKALSTADSEVLEMSRRARLAYGRSMSLSAGADAIESILINAVKERDHQE